MDKTTTIKAQHDNLEFGLVSGDTFYETLNGLNITRNSIIEFVRKQSTYQKHKKVCTVTHYHSIKKSNF